MISNRTTCPKCDSSAILVTGLKTSGDPLWGCTNPDCLHQFREKEKANSEPSEQWWLPTKGAGFPPVKIQDRKEIKKKRRSKWVKK